MNNIQLPKKVTAYVVLVLTVFSIFPYFIMRNFDLAKREGLFIAAWCFLGIFVFLICINMIVGIVVRNREENTRRKRFPTTKELDEDVSHIIDS